MNGDVFPVDSSAMKPFPPLSPDRPRNFPQKNLSEGFRQGNRYPGKEGSSLINIQGDHRCPE